MQLFLVNFILIVYALSSFVRADAVTDAIQLQGLASNTADTVFASLNGTAYLNTSDLVSKVAVAIQSADSMVMSNVSSPGTANVTLNDAYFNYVNSMLYLADTVQRRGRLFHSELNLPVYQSLQNLSSAVSTYGHDLASENLIQRNSTIRTLTTSSAIVRAQSSWANNQNYPGKRETLSWSG
ncbi:hypothetical protein M436DRAFT_49002 [Aureobasidium namibiae CBS 147.97]|uniref:Uncharacterized protein n=1 Tax=Aureobasidium namibiae CBS 147.97 TaxID=1043004 RepID=A0A074WGE3_9PEZI